MKHVSEILWWCLTRQQLLMALSLSSLPSYRKAETESGKLVMVKKPTHFAIHSTCVAAIRERQQLVTLAGSYNLISHPRAQNTSALLKYTVSNHHHICDAKVLQWEVQLLLHMMVLISRLGGRFGESSSCFSTCFNVHRWCFLWKFGEINLFTVSQCVLFFELCLQGDQEYSMCPEGGAH